jgi:hypothetical protein
MKTRRWKIADGKWRARNAVDCGGHHRSRLRPGSEMKCFQQSRAGWRTLVGLFCFFILPPAFCLRASGQTYSIDWYKIGGGGGTSTNGQYTVTGTIGQPDAGSAMTGGNYSLTGGFWAVISAVQTPGAPTVYISHSVNSVTIYWQNVSGWNLQQNSDLSLYANWADSSGVTNTNGTNYLTIMPPTGNLFFRLIKP